MGRDDSAPVVPLHAGDWLAQARLRILAGEEPRTPIEERLDGDVAGYWHDRVDRHVADVYAGVRMAKFPEDLRVYEHLLWDMRADGVLELGTLSGGSALWFRDRLRTLAAYGRCARDPHVISVDIDQREAREQLAAADPAYADSITLLEGDILDPGVVARVGEHVRWGARYLVVEDMAHTHETTAAGLAAFARLVPVGGYLVVEDGVVDIDRMRHPEWPRGVLPALDEWLATPEGSAFERRRDLELYVMTCHPGGFLQRVRP